MASSDKIGGTVATGTLGTFAGVFTPSVLTILGIILFLRLGFVVGSAGFLGALAIIGLANTISVLTSVSLSAVATNLRVKGGGDYYLISRTLGLEFGGAIGIVLFLAQSVSIAFYGIGFGEAVAPMLPWVVSPRLVATGAIAALFILAWLGADWATRFQFVVMALLVAALVAFVAGAVPQWHPALIRANGSAPAGAPPFWVLFALFFPAVTGFTQGVSMSGDLRDPGKSLPLGTFAAVGISIIVYLGVAILFAGTQTNADLAADYGAMKRLARFPALIDAGVIAATLSSAMASFLGAPRILQSLAADRIFGFLGPFSKGVGPANNPRRGVLLSGAIALVTVALGNLNLIAPVVSMFFLISYGLLNYATYFEARSASPSFRPRFRWFDRRLSLAGALACLGVMLAIDLKTGLVAVSVLFALYQYLKRTAGPARWADSRRSFHLQQVREHLLAAASEPEHPRDWRPGILALSRDPERRERLLRFAQWIAGESGLVSAVSFVEGTGVGMLRLQAKAEAELQADITRRGHSAFPLAVIAPDLEIGVSTLVQAYGIGPVKANTILLNWFQGDAREDDRRRDFGRNLRAAFRLGCNLVIVDIKDPETLLAEGERPRRIDIWWQDDATGRLALLLAHLMTRSAPWESARLKVITADAEAPEDALEKLRRTLDDVRIDADPVVIDEMTADTLAAVSDEADLVFLPFRLRWHAVVDPSGTPWGPLLENIKNAVLVLAAEDIDLDAEPEEGEAALRAEAQDALDAAKNRTQKALKATEAAAGAAEAARSDLERLLAEENPGEDDPRLSAARKKVEAAAREAESASRKAAKATAVAEQTEREALARGIAADPAKAPENEVSDD
ncbi:MAG: amino acid permease [Desulfobacterales bacterium]|nr:amino acid permease [Desulfobacterales bacterium]